MKVSQLIAFTPLPVSEAPRVAPRLSAEQAAAIARVLNRLSVREMYDILFEDGEMVDALLVGRDIIEEMARS